MLTADFCWQFKPFLAFMHARWHQEKAAHNIKSFWKFKTHLGKLWKNLPAQEKEPFLDSRGGRLHGFVTPIMRAELKAWEKQYKAGL